MSVDESAAAKAWEEYHAAIVKYELDTKGKEHTSRDYMYDGFFTGFYAGRDYGVNKGRRLSPYAKEQLSCIRINIKHAKRNLTLTEENSRLLDLLTQINDIAKAIEFEGTDD